MVIKTNTTQKETNRVNYKELLVKLSSKELLDQGIRLFRENKKNERVNNYNTDHNTVLVYDNSVNKFRFITVKTYGIGFRDETPAGTLIITANPNELKELEFPKNTLLCEVSMIPPSTINKLMNDNNFAKKLIQESIKQAEKTIEEQFITAPLNKGVEQAFVEKNSEWYGLKKSVLINLFPQFKTDNRKRIENTFLISEGLWEYRHKDFDNDSLIIDTIKQQVDYLNEATLFKEGRINSLKKLLKQLLNPSLSGEGLLDFIKFLRKEYVDSIKLFEQSLSRNEYNSYDSKFFFCPEGEFYYAMISRIIELLNEKPELTTERITSELVVLGAPFLDNNYDCDDKVSLALSFNNLLPIANKDNTIINSEFIHTMIKEFDCQNRVFFVEDFFVARLINSNYCNEFFDQKGLINELIEYLQQNNCSFVSTKKTNELINSFLTLDDCMNRFLVGYPVNNNQASGLFNDDNAFRGFIKFLSERITAIDNDYQSQGLSFFYKG